MLEPMVSFESLVADSQQRKQSKYQDLVEAGQTGGYILQSSSNPGGGFKGYGQGMVDTNDFQGLAQALRVPRNDMLPLCQSVIRTTIPESLKIWGLRNTVI